jgi:hypothetical protein
MALVNSNNLLGSNLLQIKPRKDMNVLSPRNGKNRPASPNHDQSFNNSFLSTSSKN